MKSSTPVALVTGASRGLGAYLALELSRDGYAVMIHHRGGHSQAARLAQTIRREGGVAETVRVDLSKPPQVEALFRRIHSKFQRLDVLINNAGTYRPVPLLRARPKEWQEGLESTATATFLTTRAALPLFPKAGGRIINLGDSACEKLSARKMAPGYHVGKVGVLLLTRSFAAQLADRRITVNCVSPGYLENSIDLPSPSSLPGGRPVRFGEMLAAIRYLLSPDAESVTGTNLVVSRGWNL